MIGGNAIDKDAVSDDPKQRKPIIHKAKTLLDWEPKIPLRDGLLKTIEYFQEELEWQQKQKVVMEHSGN